MTNGITSTTNQALPYHFGQINFAQYSSNLSAQVEINLPALIEAIVGLASNETLCKKLGENAIKRVKTTYDWSVVIPQMQDVWAHLAEIRAGSATTTQQFRKTHPTAPPPMAYFSKYPTRLSPQRAANLQSPEQHPKIGRKNV